MLAFCFEALVTLYQTAITRNVAYEGSAIATSLQSAMFNFSIMGATWCGGILLINLNIFNVLCLGTISLVIALLISCLFSSSLK